MPDHAVPELVPLRAALVRPRAPAQSCNAGTEGERAASRTDEGKVTEDHAARGGI